MGRIWLPLKRRGIISQPANKVVAKMNGPEKGRPILAKKLGFSTMDTRVQDLVLDNGRHSGGFPRSPILHSLFSSCTCSLVVRTIIFRKLGVLPCVDSYGNGLVHFVTNYTTLQSTDFISHLRTRLLVQYSFNARDVAT